MVTRRSLIVGAGMIASGAVVPAKAAGTEHVINMKNKGADGSVMVFEPAFVRAAVGDTIKFVPVDKGHFSVTLPNIWPEGVAPAKGKINVEFVVPLDREGLYGFKCTPHYPMGMVALVQVGNAPVTDAVKAIKFPGTVGKRMEAILALAAAP